MTDCCIIGGGVVGLSIARELAGRGLSVRVLARGTGRDTTSWAAAGILPPAPTCPGMSAGDALTAWSDGLLRRWADDLRVETGIDVGLRECGGLHVAATAAALERLRGAADAWRREGAPCEWLDAAALAACEPTLAGAVARGGLLGGFLLPTEQQVRTSRLLDALERSCTLRGVTVSPADVTGIDAAGGTVRGIDVRAAAGVERATAATYVLAAGAWTGGLAAALGLRIETRPIRGQIVLLRLPRPVLGRVVNRGLDYLVPREDGRLLVGSTLEDVGFDASTTAGTVARLRGVARDLLGRAAEAPVERVWAGLRPGTVDGLPTIGRVPGIDNAVVAAGHFRAGIHQSAGTAVLVADLVTGRPPPLDVTPFAADRPSAPPGPDSVTAMLARAAAADSP
ncbi:MAG: NAD(P)/FAD-dependent oxidoreductase [Planctomycetaceae bacterium]